MAVLPVVKFGNPILRRKTSPVEDLSVVQAALEDMFDTMYDEEGMGLAANQINIGLNFFIADISHVDEEEFPRVIINSKIIDKRGSAELEEGCLSVPDIRAIIERPAEVQLRYQDEDGEWTEEWFEGLLARVIQHEVDHLNGVFFTDYLTPAKRSLINKKLAEIAATGAPSTGIILT